MILAVMRGQKAFLSAGWYVAAELGPWSLIPQPDGTWAVSAEIVSIDEYRLYHSSKFSLRLIVGKREWYWSDVQVAPEQTRITITGVGSPELRPVVEV